MLLLQLHLVEELDFMVKVLQVGTEEAEEVVVHQEERVSTVSFFFLFALCRVQN